MAQAAKHVVTDRKKSVAKVLRVVQRSTATSAKLLGKRLAPKRVAGKEMPDLADLHRLFAATLERSLQSLVDADDALRELVQQDSELRQQRDASVRVLVGELGDLRIMLTGQLGREPSRWFLGLRGETSRDPMVLLRQANRAVARLRNPEKQPSGTKISMGDRQCWAAPLKALTDSLRRIDRQTRLSAKRLDAARLERRRALADFNATFIETATLFEKS